MGQAPLSGSEAAPATADVLGLVARSHPLRGSLSYEMHLRKLPRFSTPCRLLQVSALRA